MFKRRTIIKLGTISFWTFFFAPNVIAKKSKPKVILLRKLPVRSKRPKGSPKYSDVCFSSRWKRVKSDTNSYDSFGSAADFHATRFDWVYTVDKEFISTAKQLGYSFYCAINGLIPDWQDGKYLRGRIKDLNNQSITAPSMRKWKPIPYWGCCNSVEWQESYLKTAMKILDAGADGIHMDAPEMNYSALLFGGCFCDYCVKGFNQHLKRNNLEGLLRKFNIDKIEEFNYREFILKNSDPIKSEYIPWRTSKEIQPLTEEFKRFQVESVTNFYNRIRPKIDIYAKRKVPLSCNNANGSWGFPYFMFDYGIAELSEKNANPYNIFQIFIDSKKRGKAQVFTLVSRDVDLNRKTIAMSYACGGHTIVPWDVFIPNSPTRYFGTSENYADLYKFVRKYSIFFDLYENAYSYVHSEENSPSVNLIAITSSSICALVRSKPYISDEPIVIHLVDWSMEPKDFKITLDSKLFSGQKKLGISLLRPNQEKKDLSVTLDQGKFVINITALNPWGLLVVTGK